MAAPSTVADLANWGPPQRLIKDARGRTIVEKRSPLLSRKVVGLNGDVTQQAAANGIANRDPNDPYGQKTHQEKMLGRPRARKGTPGGILPYSRCPQGISGVREFLAELDISESAPCSTALNGKPISNDDPCKCIVEVIARRQARNRAVDAENEERINKLAKLAERTAEANLDASQKMAEAAQALAEVARASQPRKKDDAK